MGDDKLTIEGLVMPARVYTFRYGPLEVTVGPDGRSWPADIYHAGDGVVRPRFVCTGAEGLAVGLLARASADLADRYLARGLGFDRWCRDQQLDPVHPDFADRVSAEALRGGGGPLRLATRR